MVLAGPNRARSSHARTCTRTHTIEHATASGQAEMPRAGPRRADPAHKDTPTCATEPRDPGGPRTHSTSDTTTRASWVSRLTGSRRPGPRAQGSRPQTVNVTGHMMSHTRTARRARAPTPILAAPGNRGGRAGRGPGSGPRGGLRRGLGLGASAVPAPRSARLSGGQPYRTGSAAAAASTASYARARGGASVGLSRAPPP